MSTKLIFKISILVFGLVMVIFASKYFSSQPFQSSLDTAFNMGSQFQWCSGKPKWIHPTLVKKTPEQKDCTVFMESIKDVDLKTAHWEKIAEAVDSGGQAVYLEWDPALQIFRAAGLPFKSSVLSQDLAN